MDNRGKAVGPGGPAPSTTAELDELIPSCRFIDYIDSGGMGAVYKAVQKSLNRTVAVKLLAKRHLEKEGFAARFKREAQAQALLNHPNIIAVYDSGETRDGQLYYVMEFVSGLDLQHVLRRELPTPRQIMQIITQLSAALQYAHERGIVHRDIKPANILIDDRGNVKVADFGLAKIMGSQAADYTATATALGTPDYMAPEAMEDGAQIDHRADIYSLGVLIYELLTGYVPKGRWEPPSTRSGADKRIDLLVSRAMQHDPGKRYQSVDEMMPLVEKLTKSCGSWRGYRRSTRTSGPLSSAAGEGMQANAQAPLLPALEEARPRFLRSRSAMLGAAVVVVVLAGAAVAWRGGWPAMVPPAQAGAGVAARDRRDAAAKPAAASGEKKPVDAAAQTNLVRWVADHGGFLNVLTPENLSELVLPGGGRPTWPPGPVPPSGAMRLLDHPREVRSVQDLPTTEPFVVWRISFVESPIRTALALEELAGLVQAAGSVSNLNLQGLDVETEDLALLASMKTLLSLDVTCSPVITPAAKPYLTACKQLKLLRVGGAPSMVDETMKRDLRAQLPYCGIHIAR